MNKLAIPAVLVATVMIAGLFAFAPVEEASTVHDSIGQLQILTLSKTLTEDNPTTWTFTATTDSLILALWADNTEAGEVDEDNSYNMCQMVVMGVNFKSGLFEGTNLGNGDGDGIFCETPGGNGDEGIVFGVNNDLESSSDVFKHMSKDGNGVGIRDIAIVAGETATFTFYTPETVGDDADGVPLELILTIRGTGDLT